MSPATAVVFAYHNVGVRCLSALLAHPVEVQLVVTHDDNPAETIWFDSVAELAARHAIPAIKPQDPNDPATLQRLRELRPDFLFSFYYRHMLKRPLLDVARRGALNMHGSLLPRYRGRVPVNWAVINGETETGATLHYMSAKPDAGDIVDQHAVSILPDDTAKDVFDKVTAAAASVLERSLPGLLAGTAPRRAQNLAEGSYFGGRKPEDGRIDWMQPATRIHNLVRAVAPPYPGAFTSIHGETLRILRTRVEPGRMDGPPRLQADGETCVAVCGDHGLLRLVEIEHRGKSLGASEFAARFGNETVLLEKE